MSCFFKNTLNKNNIDTILNNGVQEIKETDEGLLLNLDEGTLNVDFVILCIGVKPETNLLKTLI